jgi:hypothetical protein
MHVGRLAQASCAGRVKIKCVAADFALVDDRFLVLEQVFDRVFQRQDVAGALFVAVVEHRGDRGRLAGTGGADDQQQAALFHDQFGQHRRQAEFAQRRDGRRHEAEHGRDAAALAEGRQAEAAQVGHRNAHVQLVGAVQFVDLLFRGDLGQQHLSMLSGLELVLVDRDEVPVDLDVDGRIDREEHVRRVFFFHELEQAVHHHGVLSLACGNFCVRDSNLL